MESEESGDTSTESEMPSEPDVPLDASICKPASSSASSSGPAKAIGLDKVTSKAKPGENVLEWWANKFPFARIERGAARVLTGYGVTCGVHTNANGKCAGTRCKKSLTIGESGITEQEATLRFKRWVVLGHIEKANFDPQCERQSHVNIGGTQCKDLRTDVCGWSELSEDDLNVIMAAI